MENMLIEALTASLERFWRHVRLVGLPNTDESTFRSFVLAGIKQICPTARCQTEWRKYDLLVQMADQNALIEFKFYIWRRTAKLDGSLGGWKGGAGPRNEGEFRDCIDKLACCDVEPIHHKFLVLAYERSGGRVGKYSYTASYDSLQADSRIRSRRQIPHPCQSEFTCQLLRIV